MLRKFFADRSSQPQARTHSFRPQLEVLEERVTPDAGMFPGTTPTYGPTVPTVSSAATPDSQGSFAFNSLIAFGLPPSAYALYALGGAPVSGYVAVPFQQANASNSGGGLGGGGGSVGNLIGHLESLAGSLYQIAATQNLQQANSLVSDEFFRALTSYANHVGQSLGMNNLMQGSMNAYQNAVNQNPLDQTGAGQLLGALVYDLTFYLYSSGQGSGF